MITIKELGIIYMVSVVLTFYYYSVEVKEFFLKEGKKATITFSGYFLLLIISLLVGFFTSILGAGIYVLIKSFVLN